MNDFPAYLKAQSEDNIRKRMLDRIDESMDKSEGGFIYDTLSPVSIELAKSALWAQEVLRRSFASTAFSKVPGEKTEEMTLRASEHGLDRHPAVSATGYIEIVANKNINLPKETIVSTASTETKAPIEFILLEDTVIDSEKNKTVSVPIKAIKPGVSGNVAPNTIIFLAKSVDGIEKITNPEETTGGLEEEDDLSLYARYLQKVRTPSAGGNQADYMNWALEVSGVGGVSVIPVKNGPGTVSIALVDENKKPASEDLVERVQNYIAPPWTQEKSVKDMKLGINGVVEEKTESGTLIKMTNDVSVDADVKDLNLEDTLKQPGLWQVKVNLKADKNSGREDLFKIGIWNYSSEDWATKDITGREKAVTTFRAVDLSTNFTYLRQNFYWNGEDHLELRLIRLKDETETTIWLDNVIYRSLFSQDSGKGKAPIGAKVLVEPAKAKEIDVVAYVTISDSYDFESVKEAVKQNIEEYFKSIAFSNDNNVRYVRIVQAILDTPGIKDYDNSKLTVAGEKANIDIDLQEVAVLGKVNVYEAK